RDQGPGTRDQGRSIPGPFPGPWSLVPGPWSLIPSQFSLPTVAGAAVGGATVRGRMLALGADTISATAPTMIAAANIVCGVITSPANSQPSATATTGFTYA